MPRGEQAPVLVPVVEEPLDEGPGPGDILHPVVGVDLELGEEVADVFAEGKDGLVEVGEVLVEGRRLEADIIGDEAERQAPQAALLDRHPDGLEDAAPGYPARRAVGRQGRSGWRATADPMGEVLHRQIHLTKLSSDTTGEADSGHRRNGLLHRRTDRRPVPLLRRAPGTVPGGKGATPRRVHGHRVRRGPRRLPRQRAPLFVHHGHRPVSRVSRAPRRRRHLRPDRATSRRAALQRPAPDLRPAPAHPTPRPPHAPADPPPVEGERGLDEQLADRQLAEFLADGRCEFLGDFAGPFAMLVIADLLGVPEEDHDLFRRGTGQAKGGFGSTSGETLAHTPLEFLYEAFTAYIEEHHPVAHTDDVLTRLAQATYKDGSTPEVINVVRLASNLFAAGQETTVRMLAASVQVLAGRRGCQSDLASTSRADPGLHRGDPAVREPDQGRLPAPPACP